MKSHLGNFIYYMLSKSFIVSYWTDPICTGWNNFVGVFFFGKFCHLNVEVLLKVCNQESENEKLGSVGKWHFETPEISVHF